MVDHFVTILKPDKWVQFSNGPLFSKEKSLKKVWSGFWVAFEYQTIQQPDKKDHSKTGMVRILDVVYS
jgi:hypothetical protein